ncbi:helix-turn-helix domain-containing protein [Bordetella genomosp. 13]|uniref:helix-turn-helix domain-containing protein n=1 Tax=Bordetella genomosp. 13 TaxID=463040 RepID=UPI0011A41CCF|nr:helix-turn-helix transcriptional regulator [Bordetella genomosp. 13]
MKKEPLTLVGRRLRAARLAAGVPQDQLGVAVGIDEEAASARISRYETGVHEPAHQIVDLLAQALNVPTAYIYCADDELADVILAWHRMSATKRRKLSAFLKSLEPSASEG